MLLIEKEQNKIKISGEITVNSLDDKIYQHYLQELKNGSTAVCFENVTKVDSVAVSLLITAKRITGETIKFTNIPVALFDLISLYRVDKVLVSK